MVDGAENLFAVRPDAARRWVDAARAIAQVAVTAALTPGHDLIELGLDQERRLIAPKERAAEFPLQRLQV